MEQTFWQKVRAFFASARVHVGNMLAWADNALMRFRQNRAVFENWISDNPRLAWVSFLALYLITVYRMWG